MEAAASVADMRDAPAAVIHQRPRPEPDRAALKTACETITNAFAADEGEVWYVLDYGWFQRLKKFVETNNGDKYPQPGKIDNSSLFDTDKVLGVLGEFKPIKASTREGLDFTLAPESTWKIFEQTFGLIDWTHALQRYAIGIGKEVTVEVNPLEFIVRVYNELDDDKRLLISRKATCNDLVVELAMLKRGKMHRLWRKSQGEKMELFESSVKYMSQQLKAIDFGDKEVLIVELRAMYEWTLDKAQARHQLFPDSEPAPATMVALQCIKDSSAGARSVYSGRGYQVRNSYRQQTPSPALQSPPSAFESSGYNLRGSTKYLVDGGDGELDEKSAKPDRSADRQATFLKRKTSLFEKAYELHTLTGSEVTVVVASETGHVYTYATPRLQPMIADDTGKSLIPACLTRPTSLQESPTSSDSILIPVNALSKKTI